jgi:hypothetical protein
VTLADRIRAIAAAPTPAALAELPRVAAEVARIERALDDIADDAMQQAMADDDAAARARACRDQRRHLRVVRNG